MSAEEIISREGIAALMGIDKNKMGQKLSTSTQWRTFPKPVEKKGLQFLYSLGAVQKWLNDNGIEAIATQPEAADIRSFLAGKFDRKDQVRRHDQMKRLSMTYEKKRSKTVRLKSDWQIGRRD